jgi:hydroxylamine reductase
MHMFCFQCQETSDQRGCTFGGHCGKSEETANYQDLLIYTLKGVGVVADRILTEGRPISRELGELVFEALFVTVTNTNFDAERIIEVIDRLMYAKRALLGELQRLGRTDSLSEVALWDTAREGYASKAYGVGVLQTDNVDVRALRETITYGLKGIAAYAHHAVILGSYGESIAEFVLRCLSALTVETDLDRLFDLALATGRENLAAMSLLDAVHAEYFGTPVPHPISIGVGNRPGILVTGHDLADLDWLLEQTVGTGVDVYTHSEMIAAHYYPKLFAHEHLVGNYGNAWWRQDQEFATFNGPILVTSNCIVPVADAYRDRIFTTGVAGYPGVLHLSQRLPSGAKDFSSVIALAKTRKPPTAIDEGTMPGGYNHAPLWTMANQLLELVKKGALSRVVVMAGCDGRDQRREYYKEVALGLPKDTLILTAGCAKYVFCKLPLGTIEGVPRVLDAGQCNDCYSLIHFARQLAEHLNVDVNALPISYQVCWYDQKAVAVYLSLLALGVRDIRLGPTLPAYFSAHLVERLQRDFGLKTIGDPRNDIALMMAGS